jgi:hypothetical protein
MRAYGWTGLLAISTLIISTSAFGGDKGGKVADLVKDAKVTAEQAIKTAGENVPGTVVGRRSGKWKCLAQMEASQRSTSTPRPEPSLTRK